MKGVSLAVTVACVMMGSGSACTTFHRSDVCADEIQRQILSGSLLEIGDTDYRDCRRIPRG